MQHVPFTACRENGAPIGDSKSDGQEVAFDLVLFKLDHLQ